MRLIFDRAGVSRLIEHAKAAPKQRATAGQSASRETPVPALWLVGDEGVYLMSNGQPGLASESGDAKQQFVVYAKGIAPTDKGWYDKKRRSFGGDDGIEAISITKVEEALATYRPDEPFMLDVTPSSVGLLSYKTKGRA